jgi:hypothetical protein
MSGGPETFVVVNALLSGIIQEAVQLHITIDSRPTSFAAAPQKPASAMIESPTPPPRASV